MIFCKDNTVCKHFKEENKDYGDNFKIFDESCGNCPFAKSIEENTEEFKEE